MANNRWIAAAGAVKQVNTVTPANVLVGNIFTLTIHGLTVTFTATAATVANVTAGLAAAAAASTYPEFQEVTAADGATVLTLTSNSAGKPFTQTSSASGGTATLTTAVTTANTGPNVLTAAANWSAGTAPASGEDVFLDNSIVPILYDLGGLSAVTLNSLNIAASYTGTIGLPEVNQDNASVYAEYRVTYLALGATTVNLGTGNGTGLGRFKLNTGSVQTTVNIYQTGSAVDPSPAETVLWKGTHASNVVNLFRGSFVAAPFGGEAATIATYNQSFISDQSSDATGRLASGCTLTTINMSGGSLELSAAATTVTIVSGNLTTLGSGTIATLTHSAGSHLWLSTGTIATYNLGAATLNAPGEVAHTITTMNVRQPGYSIIDPHGKVAFTNGVIYAATIAAESGTLEVGVGRTVTIT